MIAILRAQIVSLQSIKHLERKRSASSSPPTTPSPSFHPALLAVLTHLRKELTALSLAFSGPSISIDAFVGQAGKVSTLVEKLVSCVVVLDEESYLRKEWAGSVTEVILGIQKLFEIFLAECKVGQVSDGGQKSNSPAVASSSTSAPLAEPYLMQTSSLWSTIDTALSNTSSCELLAVTKILTADKECIDDAMREFKELLEEDEGLGAEEVDEEDREVEGDAEDEGWAELERELGAGQSRGMDEDERERVKNLDMIIRLSVALHNRLSQYILPLLPSPVTIATFTTFLTESHELSSEIDNLVSNLYAPQNVDELEEAALDMTERCRSICKMCEEGLVEKSNTLNAEMAKLSVAGGGHDTTATSQDAERAAKAEKEKKWLGLWTLQLGKAWKKWEKADV